MEKEELEERTGYTVEIVEPTPAPVPPTGKKPLINSRGDGPADGANAAGELDQFLNEAADLLDRAEAADLAPITNRLQALVEGPDAAYTAGLQQLLTDFPALAKANAFTPEQTTAWNAVLGAMAVNGLASLKNSQPKRTRKPRKK